MLDEGNTDAIGSERLRALYEDGRLLKHRLRGRFTTSGVVRDDSGPWQPHRRP
jgi:hypothetical protein